MNVNIPMKVNEGTRDHRMLHHRDAADQHPIAAITELQTILDLLFSTLQEKVDKEAGKALSTNDYSNAEKQKVADAYELRHSHENKNVLDATTAPYTSAEKDKLEGLENYDDTSIKARVSAIESNEPVWNAKADPSDVASAIATEDARIKEWSNNKFLTGVQWGDIAGTIESQTDLTGKLNGKVDKVAGKALSSNDYTDSDKEVVSCFKIVDGVLCWVVEE